MPITSALREMCGASIKGEKNMKLKILATVSALMVCGSAMADLTLYSEAFDGSVGTDYLGGVGNFAYGYSPGAGYKALNYDVWGAANAANSFTGGVAIPNPSKAGVSKFVGTYLDPSLFAAYDGQTVTLHFDIVADTLGAEKNAYAWVYEASGYDTSGSNDWHLDVSEVNLGTGEPMDNLLIDTTAGGATVSQVAKSGNLVTATSSTDNTLTFTYSAGTGIGLAFGSTGTDMAIDNVSISVIPEPATIGLVASFGAAMVFLRKRYRY